MQTLAFLSFELQIAQQRLREDLYGITGTFQSSPFKFTIPIDDYPQNEKTRFDHLERIRRH